MVHIKVAAFSSGEERRVRRAYFYISLCNRGALKQHVDGTEIGAVDRGQERLCVDGACHGRRSQPAALWKGKTTDLEGVYNECGRPTWADPRQHLSILVSLDY